MQVRLLILIVCLCVSSLGIIWAKTPEWHYKNKTASIVNTYSSLSVMHTPEEQKLIVALHFNRVYGDTLNRSKTVKITHRINGQPLETKYWTRKTGNMCFLESFELIKKLMEGDAVDIGIHGTVYRFLLKGSAAAIQQVLNSVPQTSAKTATGEWWDQKWKQPVNLIRSTGFCVVLEASISGHI